MKYILSREKIDGYEYILIRFEAKPLSFFERVKQVFFPQVHGMMLIGKERFENDYSKAMGGRKD